MKSSRLRHWFEPPPIQMQPRWTGSLGVASTVDQVVPPSYVVATYRCQTPANDADWSSPAVVVPRKANAARSSSPATTAGNWAFLIPSAAPTSTDGVQAPLRRTEIIGWLSLPPAALLS